MSGNHRQVGDWGSPDAEDRTRTVGNSPDSIQACSQTRLSPSQRTTSLRLRSTIQRCLPGITPAYSRVSIQAFLQETTGLESTATILTLCEITPYPQRATALLTTRARYLAVMRLSSLLTIHVSSSSRN